MGKQVHCSMGTKKHRNCYKNINNNFYISDTYNINNNSAALQRRPDERLDRTLEPDSDDFRFRANGAADDVIVRTRQHGCSAV